jgi:hypothetical protein
MRLIILMLALLFTATLAGAQEPRPSTAQPTAPQTAQPAAPQPAAPRTGTTTTTTVETTEGQTPPRPIVQAPPPAAGVQPSAATTAPTVQTSTVQTTTPARSDCPACHDAVNAYWVTFAVITGFLVIALLGMLVSLKNSEGWSFAEALSEKATTVTQEREPTNSSVAKTTTTQTPSVGSSSASRLIATAGTLVLAAMMLGVGYAMIWSLFTRGQIPALEGIGPYLMGGAALFAPYAFNQLKEAFKPAPKA